MAKKTKDLIASVSEEIKQDIDADIQKLENEKNNVEETIIKNETQRLRRTYKKKSLNLDIKSTLKKILKSIIEFLSEYECPIFIISGILLVFASVIGIISVAYTQMEKTFYEKATIVNQRIEQESYFVKVDDYLWTTNKFILRETWEEEFKKFAIEHRITNLTIEEKEVDEKTIIDETENYTVFLDDSWKEKFCGCDNSKKRNMVFAYIFVETGELNNKKGFEI